MTTLKNPPLPRWGWECSNQDNHGLDSSTEGSLPRPRLQPRSRPVVGCLPEGCWDSFLQRSSQGPPLTAPVLAILLVLLVWKACQQLKHYFFTEHTFLRGEIKSFYSNFYLLVGISIPTEMYSHIPLTFSTEIIKGSSCFRLFLQKRILQLEFK